VGCPAAEEEGNVEGGEGGGVDEERRGGGLESLATADDAEVAIKSKAGSNRERAYDFSKNVLGKTVVEAKFLSYNSVGMSSAKPQSFSSSSWRSASRAADPLTREDAAAGGDARSGLAALHPQHASTTRL